MCAFFVRAPKFPASLRFHRVLWSELPLISGFVGFVFDFVGFGDLNTMDTFVRHSRVSVWQRKKINTAVWNTLKTTTIVDESLAESFLREHNKGTFEEENFFTPPCSPTDRSSVLQKQKLLDDFLKENAARSTRSIFLLEMPIRAQWMLELYARIMEQLVSLDMLP
jgi:hypothetical protein